jgi:hypothetical protein
VRDKLIADGVEVTSAETLSQYTDSPIARGEGATALDAVSSMVAVRWR